MSTRKCKSSLFDIKMQSSGEYRTATLYFRKSYGDDNRIILSELQNPLEIKAVFSQIYTPATDANHQVDGVVEAGTYTHKAVLWCGVDLQMESYANPTVSLSQKRNILIFRDFTSIIRPQGTDNVYKIVNPDITDNLQRPYFNTLYLRWQGTIDLTQSIPTSQGALSY